MNDETTYRVIGVRHGGMRVALARRLLLDRAEFVKQALTDLVAFQELVIEKDDDVPEPVQMRTS